MSQRLPIILYIITGLALIAVFVCLILWSPIKGIQSETVWHESQDPSESDIPALTMKDGEDFRILVFADTQLGPNFLEHGVTRKMMEELTVRTEPQLIATVGDNTSSAFGRSLTNKLIRWFEDLKTPWGVTLGNHDGEGLADRAWHGNRYEEARNSLFSAGPGNIHGVGNYGVNVINESGDIVYTLVMMDSNTYRRYEEGRDYDYIYNDQIRWYRWLIEGLSESEGRLVPSMLFFHIPLPEFDEARKQWEAGELEADGGMREEVFCPPVNSGFFDVIKEVDSTTHIFNGHDHVNNLSIDWEGIRMTYVLKTGPGSYSDKDLQGGTLITIRAETGDVSVEHIYLD